MIQFFIMLMTACCSLKLAATHNPVDKWQEDFRERGALPFKGHILRTCPQHLVLQESGAKRIIQILKAFNPPFQREAYARMDSVFQRLVKSNGFNIEDSCDPCPFPLNWGFNLLGKRDQRDYIALLKDPWFSDTFSEGDWLYDIADQYRKAWRLYGVVYQAECGARWDASEIGLSRERTSCVACSKD